MEQRDGATLSAQYRRFAEEEVRDKSPLYRELSLGVAGDPEIIAFLLALPRPKRQPNLLLAAFRYLLGTPGGWRQFRAGVLRHRDALRATMLARSTQTNEPGRCAALLPVLARLPQPLALLEVGASAGLCLLPDFYGYDYGGRILLPDPGGPMAPVFPCAVDAATPVPAELPRVVWRAGIDLDPVDLADPSEVKWLEALVWPEQTDRLARLRAAITIASERRPRVVKGDMSTELAPLAREAPRDATLVIFHTAVLLYLPAPERQKFTRSVGGLCDFWIASETPAMLPEAARTAGDGPRGSYLIARNGAAVAWADVHGAWLDWIEGAG